jgi:hypothetical protein
MHVVPVDNKDYNEKQNAINTIWTFIHAALWRNEVFHEKEVLNFHYLINEHFDSTISYEKNVTRLCIRVMLFKQHLKKNRPYNLPRPALWLNKNFKNGFAKTKKWYSILLEKRKTVAGYAQPLYTLACGVYNYSNTPCTHVFQTYRDKLKHLKAYNCMDVYYNAVLFQNHLTH